MIITMTINPVAQMAANVQEHETRARTTILGEVKTSEARGSTGPCGWRADGSEARNFMLWC